MPRAHAIATDEDLCLAWQAGDPTAGSTLVARHHAAVRRFLARRLAVDPEDALQEVWTAVSTTIDRYQRRSSFRTWLFGIATNYVRVAYRSQVRTRKIQALAQDLLDPEKNDPWTVCNHRQTQDRLAASLTALPGPLQRVLALYYFERHTAVAIGRRLAIPENTVRSRVRRALQLLSDKLSHPTFAPPPRSHSDPMQAWLASVEAEFTTQPLRHAV